ncbi:MAG: hypothetical protein IT429_13710 [Gemmataceae bacterium]|nr:hypothetical protein [Gemmataceae bacterium]
MGGLSQAALLPAPLRAEDDLFPRFRQLCQATAHACVQPDNWVIPSQAYADECYLRDAYWILGSLQNLDLAALTLRRFAARQGPDGRVPTSLFLTGAVSRVRDDETTALFLLLALDLQRAGREVDRGAVERAAGFLVARLQDGQYATGPGPESWWLDTLSLARRDVVAYNQGVVAVALRAAQELGASVPVRTADAAERAYRQLGGTSGRLPLSAGTTLVDVSCLVGEHLSLRYFGRPLLSDERVRATLDSFHSEAEQTGQFLGFRVASQADGSFMPLEWFAPAPDNFPGHYHNGGSWLLYDAIALDVAARHAVSGSRPLLEQRCRAEVRRDWSLHEYLALDPAAPDFGKTPYDWRRQYGWNAYVSRLITSD